MIRKLASTRMATAANNAAVVSLKNNHGNTVLRSFSLRPGASFSDGYSSDNEKSEDERKGRGNSPGYYVKVMSPNKSRRSYATVSPYAADEIATTSETTHSPMRHIPPPYDSFYEASYFKEDYDEWDNLTGYIPSSSVLSGKEQIFDQSAEQVLTMLDTSYYHASYRARGQAEDDNDVAEGVASHGS
mmetsp:Transcript_4681/g.7270  ORF Transcript_4681/g.7270 Transcript_4681/m.7270 type:complete len:187 (-) Transcript_4681:186-746(-)